MARRDAVYRRAVAATSALLALAATGAGLAANPWDDDAAVQEVLEQRRQGIAAMTSVGASAASERYSSTFVANTPGNGVVTGAQMLGRVQERERRMAP